MSDKHWIILLVILVVIYKLIRWQEAADNQRNWKSSPPPPRQETHWSRLHPDFTNLTYVHQWKQQGYDYPATKKWMDCGVKPSELELVQWIKEFKGLSPEDITNRWGSSGVNSLRCDWQISKLPPGILGFY